MAAVVNALLMLTYVMWLTILAALVITVMLRLHKQEPKRRRRARIPAAMPGHPEFTGRPLAHAEAAVWAAVVADLTSRRTRGGRR